MAVGTMRTAFERALDFARRDARGGSMPIIERQSLADLMIEVKINVDAARAVVWKALDSLDARVDEGKITFENCLEAKIFASEVALLAVYKCPQAVGITSYAEKSVFPRLLNDAAM
ncbi:acyl-CoA dehydrogenase/oxidase C-terminal [Aspergillus filifer]